MKISIIGTGNIGSHLGRLLSDKGHDEFVGSRNPEAKKIALENLAQRVKIVSYKEAFEYSKVIVMATPFHSHATADALREAKTFRDKILIDATNPLNPDYSPFLFEQATLGAEEIAKLAHQAKVVKAFNTIFAHIMVPERLTIRGEKISCFIASDDAGAKQVATDLSNEIGFKAIDAGTLENARYLEGMVHLGIQLAFSLGYGNDAGFAFLTRQEELK